MPRQTKNDDRQQKPLRPNVKIPKGKLPPLNLPQIPKAAKPVRVKVQQLKPSKSQGKALQSAPAKGPAKSARRKRTPRKHA